MVALVEFNNILGLVKSITLELKINVVLVSSFPVEIVLKFTFLS